jgi:hypothetical protein
MVLQTGHRYLGVVLDRQKYWRQHMVLQTGYRYMYLAEYKTNRKYWRLYVDSIADRIQVCAGTEDSLKILYLRLRRGCRYLHCWYMVL